jgi:DNA-directed RNA polymerase I subunit RPA1
MGDTLFEHPQNELLTKVLTTSYRLRDLNAELQAASLKDAMQKDPKVHSRIFGELLEALVQLQIDVNSFIDSGKNPAPVRQGKLPPAGVKQGLEKKEGLFRMHMMVRLILYPLNLYFTLIFLRVGETSQLCGALSNFPRR